MPRRLFAFGSLLVLAGCVHPTMTSAGPPVVVCGTTLWSGAMTPVVWRLNDPSPGVAPPPAPTGDQLPPPTSLTAGEGFDDYVRLGGGCAKGAVVSVAPLDGARLRKVARAKDGHLAAIVLEVTAPVTVRAWQGGKYLGERQLDPTVSEPGGEPGSVSPTR